MNHALELKNLTKRYKDFTLQGLDLTLPKGCIMGLVGENGAGKTTTIKLILDLITPDEGEISVMGLDSRKDGSAIKELCGIVPDEIGFPQGMNALQVGKVMKHTYKNWDGQAYKDHLARFGLPEKKSFKEYSKGMKMKLGIAVALSHNAKLLILDEATSGLDPVVRDEVVALFGEFTREEDRAVLISSHIVSDLEKICDYIAFVHDGKLLLCEEKDALLAKYGCWQGSRAQMDALPAGAVCHFKETPYGVEAILSRAALSEDVAIAPLNMEELFLFKIKEAKK